MDLNFEKIATHVIVLLIGTIYAKTIKAFSDLNASFRKIREIEQRVKKLEGDSNG